jgi:hypothetical protein
MMRSSEVAQHKSARGRVFKKGEEERKQPKKKKTLKAF